LIGSVRGIFQLFGSNSVSTVSISRLLVEITHVYRSFLKTLLAVLMGSVRARSFRVYSWIVTKKSDTPLWTRQSQERSITGLIQSVHSLRLHVCMAGLRVRQNLAVRSPRHFAFQVASEYDARDQYREVSRMSIYLHFDFHLEF